MTTHQTGRMFAALVLATTLFLTGCGGGGGNTTGDDTSGNTGETTPGSITSLNEKAHAARTDAEIQAVAQEISDALAMGNLEASEAQTLNRFVDARRESLKLPTIRRAHQEEPTKTYVPLSVELARIYGSRDPSDPATLVLPDDGVDIQISSIRRNAGNGFDITVRYIEPEEDTDLPVTVSFLPENCTPEDGCQATVQIPDDGVPVDWTFWLWELDGSWSQYDYMNVHHLSSPWAEDSVRSFIVHGIDTPPDAMPTLDTATYSGNFRADAFRTDSPDGSYRQRYQSRNLTLTVDFDTGMLTGDIKNIGISLPGQSSRNDRVVRPSSSFSITNGRIDANGFTATLTGADSDPTVSDAISTRGFTGSINGRFFGPTAEEFGGVLNASRNLPGNANDLNMYGYVIGKDTTE